MPDAYGTLLQIREDGLAISRREGALELLVFDPIGFQAQPYKDAILPRSIIRQRHALDDFVDSGSVVEARFQNTGARTNLDLVVIGESTGESRYQMLVISDFSQPRSLPLHVDESAFVRHQIPADLDGNGSEESLLIQGVISRPDPTIAGAYQERPLLLLKEINDGVNQIIGGVLTQDNAKALVAQKAGMLLSPRGLLLSMWMLSEILI